MNVVLFSEPLDLLLYKEIGIIVIYLIPCLILFTLARKRAKNVFILGIIDSFTLFWYLFYPALYSQITQINYISANKSFLAAKNSLNSIIISSPIEKVRFYCIYTIISRRNKFYNKAGIEMNNRIYYFSLKRNCDEFQSRLSTDLTASFISVEKKEGIFPNYDSTAVLFLLALRLAHMGATLALN